MEATCKRVNHTEIRCRGPPDKGALGRPRLGKRRYRVAAASLSECQVGRPAGRIAREVGERWKDLGNATSGVRFSLIDPR